MNRSLADHRYMVVEGLIDKRLASLLYNCLLLRQWRGEFKRDDQVPTAHCYWGDSTLDAVLLTLQPDIERACGCTLLPTYAYARLYVRGNTLPRHCDRLSCEVAATIHLGFKGKAPPPIQFAPNIAVTQQVGDAVIYLGDQIDHWRGPFEGDDFGQIFLNYVLADGKRQHCLHDGRQEVFPPWLSAARVTNYQPDIPE